MPLTSNRRSLETVELKPYARLQSCWLPLDLYVWACYEIADKKTWLNFQCEGSSNVEHLRSQFVKKWGNFSTRSRWDLDWEYNMAPWEKF